MNSSTRRVSTLALLVLGTAGLCLAGRPSIIINSDPPDPIVAGSTFSFTANATGGGDISVTNESGQRWFSLDIFVNLPESTPIICGPGPFGTCTTTVTNGPNNTFNYDISLGPSPLGIQIGENFSIDLDDNGLIDIDPNGTGSWGPNTQFSAAINGVPEPATYGLCGIALLGALLLGWRRRFFGRASAGL